MHFPASNLIAGRNLLECIRFNALALPGVWRGVFCTWKNAYLRSFTRAVEDSM
jgi:hypothetical protein